MSVILKYHKIGYHVYADNMSDLGIYVSSDCSFKFHITNLNKRTTHLTSWILRTFTSRDKLTLFKALVMS